MTSLSPGRWPIVLITLALATVMACWLPYHVSLGRLPDTTSLSVAAGFDQRIAILGVFAVMGAAVLLAASRTPPAATQPVAPFRGPGLDASFAVVAVLIVVLTLVLLVNGDDRYNEVYYFTDRNMLMLQGKLPYRDFLFNYGPLLMWPAYLTGLAVGRHWLLGYAIGIGASLLLGLWLLRHIVRALPVPDATRGLIFLGPALFWLPLTYSTGLHYGGLRFIVPVVLAFEMRRLHGAGLGWLCAGPLLASMLAFGFSFEIGVAILLLGAGVLGFLALAERRLAPLLALGVYIAAWAGLVLLLPGWFVTALTANFSGREYPLVPNIFLIFTLFSLVVAVLSGVPPLIRAAITGRWVLAPADFGLCLVAMLALMLLPGAIGRADFIHLFAYAMGAVLATACWAANGTGPQRLQAYAGATLLLVVVNQALLVNLISHGLAASHIGEIIAGRAPGPASVAVKQAEVRKTGVAIATRYPGAYDPFLVTRAAPGIVTGYYTGSNDVFGDYAVTRKRAELDASRIYLLPASLKAPVRGEPSAQMQFEQLVAAYLVLWPFPITIDSSSRPGPLDGFVTTALANCNEVERIGSVRICRNRSLS